MEKHYDFEPNIWVKFEFEGNQCIGRTLIHDDEELIIYINELCNAAYIPFHIPKKLSKLKILDKNINKNNDLSANQNQYEPPFSILRINATDKNKTMGKLLVMISKN